jgi:hypothetical protein
VSREGLPPGIRRRHARQCEALPTDDMSVCTCRPAYQAQAGPRRQRQTRTFPTLTAAKSWKRDIDRAWERGEMAGRAPALEDAARDWLEKAQRGIVLARGDKPYRPSTLRGYGQCMEADLFGELGHIPLDRITRGQLNAFVEGLQARGLAAQTVKNIVIPLRAVYRHAWDLEQVTVNPTVGLKVPAGSGRRLAFLAPSEIAPTLDALEQRDRALWATAVYAGLRRERDHQAHWQDHGPLLVRPALAANVRREVRGRAGPPDPDHRRAARPSPRAPPASGTRDRAGVRSRITGWALPREGTPVAVR